MSILLCTGGSLTAANQIRSSHLLGARTIMAKGYSTDLRDRVVALVEGGESCREAASLLDLGPRPLSAGWIAGIQPVASQRSPAPATVARRSSRMSSGCSIWWPLNPI